MKQFQSGIIDAIPAHAEYLYFTLQQDTNTSPLHSTVQAIAEHADGKHVVLGLGHDLCQILGLKISALHNFDIEANPSNPEATSTTNLNADLWCWLRAEERGDLLDMQRQVLAILEPHFSLAHQVSAFRYRDGRDLTGYEDGTENPVDEDALNTAFINDINSPLHGSSFVAVQQWQHQMQTFHAMKNTEQDHIIGRRKSDNEELDEAPSSAHVKRTAQESFTPEAFVLRRSMPWSQQSQSGLLFAAFATSFDAFEAQYKRMLGYEDGISDGLFRISRPINTHYFWCPPIRHGKIQLR